ncbi:Nuclear elongation and deformation protein 1 [Yarrowia sp. C11]|nr:Nuclear elongation and deformation protein 1 [Yarrowia sp. C11]KAG5359438.1 Nuclear elongation and deformation protein 1 [Yarrowia sp. E02]
MQYVGRAIGTVSKTWNSINPATLSGAIDIIVVEREDGELNCSPFHVRFGIFSLLRPSQKKVEFCVNGTKTELPMKVGDGGEVFFVFETDADVPDELLTSPVISPSSSPSWGQEEGGDGEPDYLALNDSKQTGDNKHGRSPSVGVPFRSPSADHLNEMGSLDDGTDLGRRQRASTAAPEPIPGSLRHPATISEGISSDSFSSETDHTDGSRPTETTEPTEPLDHLDRSLHRAATSPAPSSEEIWEKARALSKKLTSENIQSKISDNGDIILDMTGYKYDHEDVSRSEELVKKILAEELGEDRDLSHILVEDEEGNLVIQSAGDCHHHHEQMSSPESLAHSPHPLPSSNLPSQASDNKHYAKTIRLTSDQLKSLDLKPGKNEVTFAVNNGKTSCSAQLFYWKHDIPVVISDIDGTITKSDALGHLLTMMGRDWTHTGVAKLFSDIRANGYNIMYLTARSVGQADATRAYLGGVDQFGFKLPPGPVILSPDRTLAALKREVILKKPEVFKMACLRDIKSLFGETEYSTNPFYAGFGNRITDALSYRSVGVPSSRIFTINSNAEVHMELLELAGYKSSYVHIADLVDHFFPPETEFTTIQEEKYTDVNYWRDPIIDLSDLTDDELTDYDEPSKSPKSPRSPRSPRAGSAGSNAAPAGSSADPAGPSKPNHSSNPSKFSYKKAPTNSRFQPVSYDLDLDDGYEYDDDDDYDDEEEFVDAESDVLEEEDDDDALEEDDDDDDVDLDNDSDHSPARPPSQMQRIINKTVEDNKGFVTDEDDIQKAVEALKVERASINPE